MHVAKVVILLTADGRTRIVGGHTGLTVEAVRADGVVRLRNCEAVRPLSRAVVLGFITEHGVGLERGYFACVVTHGKAVLNVAGEPSVRGRVYPGRLFGLEGRFLIAVNLDTHPQRVFKDTIQRYAKMVTKVV